MVLLAAASRETGCGSLAATWRRRGGHVAIISVALAGKDAVSGGGLTVGARIRVCGAAVRFASEEVIGRLDCRSHAVQLYDSQLHMWESHGGSQLLTVEWWHWGERCYTCFLDLCLGSKHTLDSRREVWGRARPPPVLALKLGPLPLPAGLLALPGGSPGGV